MIDCYNIKVFFKDVYGEIFISIQEIEIQVCYFNYGYILVKISYDKEVYGFIGRKFNRICLNLYCIRML